MNAVVEILIKHREEAIDQLVAAIVEGIPRYSLADTAEVRANSEALFEELASVIETGATQKLTSKLNALTIQRIEQGFLPADFVRSIMMAYPIVRTIVRKAGPRNDAVFGKMFEEVEIAIFRLVAIASNIFASGMLKASESKTVDLVRQNEELKEHELELEGIANQQKRRAYAAEEFNARVIASLSSGIMVVEGPPNDVVLLWSRRMESITGVAASDVVGKKISEVAKQFSGLAFDEMYQTVEATDRLPMTKVHVKMPSGVERTLFMRGERLRQEDAQSTPATVIIIDDTTEREMLIDSFSRYVSKEVVQRLLSRSSRSNKLEGERRACSILFADIRGFTGISERITPEALHELLNQYFRVMIEQVTAHDGAIDKFIGDKIMAIFTGSETEGAVAALRAAAAIQSEIAKLNALRESESAEPITVGIGVNTGTVIMGTVGSEERMSFTVLGDAVNVADRLQSLASAGETYVGMRTRELTNGLFELEELGTRNLKGRSNPETMFKLLRLKG